ncbi:MAG TPA: exodeoxyribonuclease VII large subunit [Bryobacteraceae bacterium]|nr:exodeoxyribonuclease VII large subunit [Bryobacteraceae bacterium]
MEQIAFRFEPGRRVFTVAELNTAIHGLLEREFADVWVTGEISGTRLAASGHYYFTLKEQDAQLRCVCFRQTARYLKFKPQDGVAVIARGRIDVYEVRGEYQLLVETLEPQGRGALQLAFEQLKKKLAAEGLFDQARKRPIPAFPRRIGIVTSPSGAAIRDLLNILERRFPGLHIRLFPAQVQGEGAVEDVCRGIEHFGASGWADVLIVGRGGGSLEDLWTFNEEAVARAIAACPVPVISAVGHETDVTIADFVADLRAPTPSAAAELVVGTRQHVVERIEAAEAKLRQSLRYRLSDALRKLHQRGIERATSLLSRRIGRALQRVDELDYELRQRMRSLLVLARGHWGELDARLKALDLRLRFAQTRQRLEAADRTSVETMRATLARARRRYEPLAAELNQLSPLRVLDRGYAIVQDDQGRILKDAADAPPPSEIAVRLARGRLKARVTD